MDNINYNQINKMAEELGKARMLWDDAVNKSISKDRLANIAWSTALSYTKRIYDKYNELVEDTEKLSKAVISFSKSKSSARGLRHALTAYEDGFRDKAQLILDKPDMPVAVQDFMCHMVCIFNALRHAVADSKYQWATVNDPTKRRKHSRSL